MHPPLDASSLPAAPPPPWRYSVAVVGFLWAMLDLGLSVPALVLGHASPGSMLPWLLCLLLYIGGALLLPFGLLLETRRLSFDLYLLSAILTGLSTAPLFLLVLVFGGLGSVWYVSLYGMLFVLVRFAVMGALLSASRDWCHARMSQGTPLAPRPPTRLPAWARGVAVLAPAVGVLEALVLISPYLSAWKGWLPSALDQSPLSAALLLLCVGVTLLWPALLLLSPRERFAPSTRLGTALVVGCAAVCLPLTLLPGASGFVVVLGSGLSLLMRIAVLAALLVTNRPAPPSTG